MVFVHHDVPHATRDEVDAVGVEQQVVYELLLMRKIQPVSAEQGFAVGAVGLADAAKQRLRSVKKLLRVDEFFRDFIEVVTYALDRRPLGRPFAQIAVLDWWTDDLLEVLKDKQELSQLIECLVVVAKRGAMPMRREQAIAQPVNSRDLQLGEVSRVPGLPRYSK